MLWLKVFYEFNGSRWAICTLRQGFIVALCTEGRPLQSERSSSFSSVSLPHETGTDWKKSSLLDSYYKVIQQNKYLAFDDEEFTK